jgi:2'-5' RNA ligase
MIRTFLAINPSAETLDTLERFQAELRETAADVRWVDSAFIHLTVQFLGDVRESELAGTERALAETFREQAPIEMDCRGFGAFPNLRRPRILWVGVHGEGLASLAERAERALAPVGFPPQDREFDPHITLGRVRSQRGVDALIVHARERANQGFGVSRIDCAILYRSQLRPTGSLYTPIATFPFLGAEASD